MSFHATMERHVGTGGDGEHDALGDSVGGDIDCVLAGGSATPHAVSVANASGASESANERHGIDDELAQLKVKWQSDYFSLLESGHGGMPRYGLMHLLACFTLFDGEPQLVNTVLDGFLGNLREHSLVAAHHEGQRPGHGALHPARHRRVELGQAVRGGQLGLGRQLAAGKPGAVPEPASQLRCELLVLEWCAGCHGGILAGV